jgi:transglutaminase-like putative cysteine protease
MKPNNALGFPTASQVCRDLEGDCRQHAVLTAALCRAAAVPARTAVGVIYVREPGRSPVFVFHMWTEVHVAGQWLGVDATLGQGGIGATHLKIADQSWRDTQTLAPLLPVVRVLGKVAIDVVSAR